MQEINHKEGGGGGVTEWNRREEGHQQGIGLAAKLQQIQFSIIGPFFLFHFLMLSGFFLCRSLVPPRRRSGMPLLTEEGGGGRGEADV